MLYKYNDYIKYIVTSQIVIYFVLSLGEHTSVPVETGTSWTDPYLMGEKMRAHITMFHIHGLHYLQIIPIRLYHCLYFDLVAEHTVHCRMLPHLLHL